MPRPPKKPTPMCLRVGKEMAAMLRAMPNASAFIRHAILAHAGCLCPLCSGKGVVSRVIAEHFAEAVQHALAQHVPDAEDGLLPPSADGTGG